MEEVEWNWRERAKDSEEQQERLRAQYVIEKAQARGWNVIETLTQHMVARKLIEELTGETLEFERKPREQKVDRVREWATQHVGETVSPYELSQQLSVSYDTALNIVKTNPFYFTKIKKGSYSVHDGLAEREEAKKAAKEKS